jgi:hypothetical protein
MASSLLPYVHTATPDEPIRCHECRIEKDHGDFIETTKGCVYCASCVWTFDTALTVHSMERDGHAPPPEARDAR